MKVILDIEETRAQFFLELLNSLDYVRILNEFKTKETGQTIKDLAEAFSDVKLHEEGKKHLKSAKDFLSEI